MARLCDVIGQKAAVSGLLSALRGERVSGAYVFAGPSQVGRATTAVALAAALHCEAPDASFDACGSCTSCRRVRDGHHPDVLLVQPETHAVKMDQVREVKRWAAISPFHGGRKVAILCDAERLTPEAGNSLLKLLEESNAACVFILITQHAHQMLPTLISRCRLIPFHRVAGEELERALVSQGVDSERAKTLAALAGGRPGRVLQAADVVEELASAREAVVEWVKGLQSTPTGQRLIEMDGWGKDRRQVEGHIRLLQSWLRDLAVWRSAGEAELLTHVDRVDEIRVQAEGHELSAFVAALECLDVALGMLRSQGSVRLVSDYVAIGCGRALGGAA